MYISKRFLILTCVLSFLSACSEESTTVEPVSTKPVVREASPAITKTVEQSLHQQVGQLESSLKDITSTLGTVSNDFEKNITVNKDQVNVLAKQLGQLARQAGESAKTLEESGKTLGSAIQEGFNEGYNKKND